MVQGREKGSKDKEGQGPFIRETEDGWSSNSQVIAIRNQDGSRIKLCTDQIFPRIVPDARRTIKEKEERNNRLMYFKWDSVV